MMKSPPWITVSAFALLALSIPTSAGDWTTEKPQQAYLLRGCDADSGTLVLTLNAGTHVYRINSSSPIYRAALSVGEKSVAKGKQIQVYALGGYPTITHRIQGGNGICSDAVGIDILGISIDQAATNKVVRQPIANSGIVLLPRENGTVLTILGAARTCELLDLSGRVVATSRPNADGTQSISLVGLRKGAFIVRSGATEARFTKI